MNMTVDWNLPFLGRDWACGPGLHNVQRQRERALGLLGIMSSVPAASGTRTKAENWTSVGDNVEHWLIIVTTGAHNGEC